MPLWNKSDSLDDNIKMLLKLMYQFPDAILGGFFGTYRDRTVLAALRDVLL